MDEGKLSEGKKNKRRKKKVRAELVELRVGFFLFGISSFFSREFSPYDRERK